MTKLKIIRLTFLFINLVLVIAIFARNNISNLWAVIPAVPLGLFVFHELVLRPRMERMDSETNNDN